MSISRRISILALLAACGSLPGLAQTPPPAAIDDQASQAYAHQQWDKSEQLYAELTKSNPDNARYWYRYAVSAQATKHYPVALEAFAEAKKRAGNGLPAFFVDYSISSVQAAMGHADEAFATLTSAANEGFAQPEKLESDPEWSALRADPRYAPLLLQAKHNLSPCTYSAESRQFDFWVGDWDVFRADDSAVPVGTSHIARELSDCVIWENWTSARMGYAGKSYNVYDVNLKRWEQFWVDNSAGMVFFYGNLKDGVMDYWTDDVPQPDGKTLKRHLQFFNLSPDTVRQFSQNSADGGKTWTVDYDFIYRRRKI